MIGNKNRIYTGIDLGISGAKLVRGTGNGILKTISHVGIEDYEEHHQEQDIHSVALALRILLKRLKLKKGNLGRIAVAVRGPEIRCKEISLTGLGNINVAQSLHYEARKHLDLEGMESPQIATQVLSVRADSSTGSDEETRVLFAAAPKKARTFPLAVLEEIGLCPDVIDLQPLADLNALLAITDHRPEDGKGVGLIDIGRNQTSLSLSCPSSGMITRSVGPQAPHYGSDPEKQAYYRNIVSTIRETLTFFRGRYRCEVEGLFVSGFGASMLGLTETLSQKLNLNVCLLDPLGDLANNAVGRDSDNLFIPRLTTACGLCRWGNNSAKTEASHV